MYLDALHLSQLENNIGMKTGILKKFLIVLAAILPFVVSAQIVDPVKWKFSSELISETEADIIAIATIESKWHVYAQIISSDPKAADSGPIPTKLFLSKSNLTIHNYWMLPKIQAWLSCVLYRIA
jgi:hypothetical protein